jgi:hypothetical protein
LRLLGFRGPDGSVRFRPRERLWLAGLWGRGTEVRLALGGPEPEAAGRGNAEFGRGVGTGRAARAATLGKAVRAGTLPTFRSVPEGFRGGEPWLRVNGLDLKGTWRRPART